MIDIELIPLMNNLHHSHFIRRLLLAYLRYFTYNQYRHYFLNINRVELFVEDMMIRTLTGADIPALVELCRRTLPLDRFTESVIRRRIFQEPGFNERYLLVDEREGKLIAAMLGFNTTDT